MASSLSREDSVSVPNNVTKPPRFVAVWRVGGVPVLGQGGPRTQHHALQARELGFPSPWLPHKRLSLM